MATAVSGQLGVTIRGTPRPQTPEGLISGHYPLQDWATSILSLPTWCLSAQLLRPSSLLASILRRPLHVPPPAECRAATSKSTTPAPVQSRGNRESSPLRHNTSQTRGHDRPSFAKAAARDMDWAEDVHVIVGHYIACLSDPVLGLCAPQNSSPPAAPASVL